MLTGERKQAYISVILASVILVLIAFMIFSRTPSISPNILYLTQPVNTISGKVTDVNNKNNTITVSYEPASELGAVGSQSNSSPSAKHKLLYHVRISKETRLTRDFIPYDYKSRTGLDTGASSPVFADIKTGQTVAAKTAVDLRILSTDTFVAQEISLPPSSHMVNGMITGKDASSITVHAAPFLAPDMSGTGSTGTVPEQEDYLISVPAGIPIIDSLASGNPLAPLETKLTNVADIPVNANVTVYTTREIGTSRRMEAAFIMFQSNPVITPASTPTPSLAPPDFRRPTPLPPTPIPPTPLIVR